MFENNPFATHTGEILIMLIVAFLLGLLLGYLLWHRYKKMNVALQADYDKLKAKYTELEKDHASLKYQHDQLDKDNKALRSKVRSLEADVAILQGKLDKLTEAENGGDDVSVASAKGIASMAAAAKDDLKKIEGIGPKIEGLLNEAGIHTFAQLSSSKVQDLEKVLNDAGPRYKMHDPKTWPKQGELAAAGKWDELQEYQDFLQGGKDPG